MVEKERCKDMRWGRTMCKVYFSKKFRLERGKNKSEQKRGEIVAGLCWTYVHMTGARQPRMDYLLFDDCNRRIATDF